MLDCPCRTLSPAESLAKLVVLKLCGVRGQPGEQSSACGAQAGEESSSQRTPRMHSGMRLGWKCLGTHHLPSVSLVEEDLCGVHGGLELSPEALLPETGAETHPSVL